MKHYVNFINRYKVAIITIISLFVVALSISIKDIAFEGSYRIWFDSNSKIIKDYDSFREEFGSDETFIVAFEDKNSIFNKKAIKTIDTLTKEFEQIDGVKEVKSLTNYKVLSKTKNEVTLKKFISSHDNLNKKATLAKNDSLLSQHLLSYDNKSALIAIILSQNTKSNEEVNIYVMEKIKNILKKYKNSNYKFYLSGVPAITASLVTIAKSDAIKLMPLAVVIVVVLLFIIFRSYIGILVPSVVIVYTFLIVLSMQILLGYKLNNFTVNIPAFISAIAIANSMHLLIAWINYKKTHKSNYKAIYLALKNNFLAIALTSLTTATGFATLMFSKIIPISTLGLAITSGALISFILTVVLAPAILLLLKDDYNVKEIKLFNLIDTKGYGEFIYKHHKSIIGIFFAILVAIGYGLTKVKVDSNSIKYFKKETIVRSGSDFIESKITGAMRYEVLINTKKDKEVLNPNFLNKVTKFEKELKKSFVNVTTTSSLKDIIVAINNFATLQNSIPSKQESIESYIKLFNKMDKNNTLSSLVDKNYKTMRLSINSKTVATSKDLKMIEWIKEWWSKNSNYNITISGQSTIFTYMQSSVTHTLVVSILATLALVTLAMYLIFRRNISFFNSWLFILPNIAPLILVAGVMGYLDITIDIGVAISASVILGIAVDDTIHFFSKFFIAIKKMEFKEAIDYVISHSGNAMILTTFILSLTFGVFGLSSFMPNVNFAIVTIIALNIALLLDLVLLPALLALMYTKK